MITIHLECPHCENINKIQVSDPIWIMLETCRMCQEWSIIFMGTISPLDKNIMETGCSEDKKKHILEKLGMLIELLVRMHLPDPVEE